MSERTIELAATRAGIGGRTLRAWLTEDDAFKAEYEQARQATFDAAMHRIQALTARAVETLEELLDDKRSPAVRLGAARPQGVSPEELVRILHEGRARAARREHVPRSPEESLAFGRRLRALLRGEQVEGLHE